METFYLSCPACPFHLSGLTREELDAAGEIMQKHVRARHPKLELDVHELINSMKRI